MGKTVVRDSLIFCVLAVMFAAAIWGGPGNAGRHSTRPALESPSEQDDPVDGMSVRVDPSVFDNPDGVFMAQCLSVGPNGSLYASEWGQCWLCCCDRPGETAFRRIFGQPGFDDYVSGIAVGPDGSLYVSQALRASVARLDPQTGKLLKEFVAPGAGGLVSPAKLTFGPDGHLYVASRTGDSVLRFDGKTGAFMNEFVTAKNGGLDGPWGMVFNPDGDLLVASYHNARILRFDGKTGAFLDDLVPCGLGGLRAPCGMAIGPDHCLYVADLLDADILRYDASSGEFRGVFARFDSRSFRPLDLAFAPNGELAVGSPETPAIVRLDGASGALLRPVFTVKAPAE